MEVVGAAASFIAIGQALAGIPKLVGIIQTVANTRDELNDLLFDLEILAALSDDIQHCIQSVSLMTSADVGAPSEPVYIKRLESELEHLLLQLQALAGDCKIDEQQRISKKLRVKWVWQKSKIIKLCERAQRIQKYLQGAMNMLAFRVSLHAEQSQQKLLVEIHAVTTKKLLLPETGTQSGERPHAKHFDQQENAMEVFDNKARTLCSCNCASRFRNAGFNFDFSLWVAKRRIDFSVTLDRTRLGVSLSLPLVLTTTEHFDILLYSYQDIAAQWFSRNRVSPKSVYINGEPILEYALRVHQWEVILHWLRNYSHMIVNTPYLEQAAIRSQSYLQEPKLITEKGAHACRWLIQLAGLDTTNSRIHEALFASGNLELAIAYQPDAINELDMFGEAPLHTACRTDDLEACITLLKFGADKNVRDYLGSTPLHTAAAFGSSSIVKLLLDAGCDWDIYNSHGELAMELAMDCGDKDAAIDILTCLLGKRASMSRVNIHGETILHSICYNVEDSYSTEEYFRQLMHAGGTQLIEARCRNSTTPLLKAIKRKNEVMVRLLLLHGARTDVIDYYNMNILHCAAAYYSPQVLALLDQVQISGIDIRTTDYFWTPLEYFRYCIHTSIEDDPLVVTPSREGTMIFERLLRGVRDRGITAECILLEQLIFTIRNGKVDDARKELGELVEKKIRDRIEDEARTFRAIDLDLRRGELELAIISLEEFMAVSKERLDMSPFDEETCRWCGTYHRETESEDVQIKLSSQGDTVQSGKDEHHDHAVDKDRTG